jgi:hypothetical protein
MDLRAGADAHEIDMQRRVGDRMILDLARQRAMHRAVDRHIDDGREKPGAANRARQFARLEADRRRLLVVAIDDAGNAPGPPRRPRRALAGARRGSALRLMISGIAPTPLLS